MSGGYQRPAGDGLGPLIRELEGIKRRLSELEIPTGTSMNSLVAQVQEAIAAIGTTVNAWLEANSYTASEIDAKIASPGDIAPGNVTASGEVTGNQGTFASGLSSPGAYNTLVTGGGAYRATWQHETGYYGYAPSSRRFKTDIESFVPDAATIEALKSLRVVMFRYYARPPYDQAQQPQVYGLIAEEVHDLGLTWLVDYDEDGLPFGVRYDMLSLAMLLLWQYA